MAFYIKTLYGRSNIAREDLDRAYIAARGVFTAHNTTPEAAHTAFVREWEWLSSTPLLGPAAVWAAAGLAASVALTKDWANPHITDCTIYVLKKGTSR